MKTAEKLQITMPGDVEMTVTRTFAASRALLFDCHTRPDLVRRWLLGPPGWTMPVCDIDLRVGGKFRYVWRHPEQPDLGLGGTFREIARPERVVHTEAFDNWPDIETLVTSIFTEEKAGRSRVAITVRFPAREAREAALATGMTEGWNMSYDGLDRLLAAGI